MSRNNLIKYLFLCLPFITGAFMFCFGVFNLFSSVLFFVGGYIALKKIFDYWKEDKFKKSRLSLNNGYSYKSNFLYRSNDNSINLKRYKKHCLVKKRIK